MKEEGSSLRTTSTPVGDGRPWIQFRARDAIRATVPTNPRVLEFGAGGSTLYWLGLGASVTCVVHDPVWAESVRERARAIFGSSALLDLRVVPPEQAQNAAELALYGTTDESLRHLSFRGYVHAADDVEDGSVDLLMVDGRARSAALQVAARKAGPNGLIVLDNSERDEYQAAQHDLGTRGWVWTRYFGPVPYLRHFSETAIATRARSCVTTNPT